MSTITYKQEKKMSRYTPNKVVKVPTHSIPKEYKNREDVVVYSIRGVDGFESYVSFKRSKVSKLLVTLRWKVVYHFNRITRKW